MNVVARVVATPIGTVFLLALAAILEALGDSWFQTGIHRSSGPGRVLAILLGCLILAAYGATVNVPQLDFGRLIGVYIAFFFVTAQVLNRVRFHQAPTAPIYAGGALIVAGALVMAFWQI